MFTKRLLNYCWILSLNTRDVEGAIASIGLYADMLSLDPYKPDDTYITKGWVQVAEGKKGEKGHQASREEVINK